MTERVLVAGIVRLQGHHVLQAGQSEEAVKVFQQLEQHELPAHLLEDIRNPLRHFPDEPPDDLSLVLIESCVPGSEPTSGLILSNTAQLAPIDWSVSFKFLAQTLRYYNPLPFILRLLLKVQGLRSQSGALSTVLTELYSNALEHGVLGLDSAMKKDAYGLTQYYALRKARLEQLEQGDVSIGLQIQSFDGNGGRLLMSMSDSGAGFDTTRRAHVDKHTCSGRGMSLVRELSRNAKWSDDGRRAYAEFTWESQAISVATKERNALEIE